MKIPIDATTGYSYQYQNIGKTSNTGVEVALNYDIIRTKDFSLSVSGTYNYNKNNIDELSDAVTGQYSSKWASSATQPSFYNDSATTEIYSLSLHDPIYVLI